MSQNINPINLILSDLHRNKNANKWYSLFLELFASGGFRAIFLYRIHHHYKNIIILRQIIVLIEIFFSKIEINPYSQIGRSLNIPHPQGIVIGALCVIGENVTIESDVTIGRDFGEFAPSEGYPHIGNNVFIGTGAKIIGEITIGDNCIIGANAVVVKDVPRNAIVAGVPAKVIRFL